MNIKSRLCFFLLSIVFIIIFFTPDHLLSSDRGRFRDPAGQRIKALPPIKCFCSFSLMPKEMTKERAPASLGPSGSLRAQKSAGSLKTRYTQTVQTPYTSDFRVLSYVPMGIEQQPLWGCQCRVLWTLIFTPIVFVNPAA